MSWPESPRPAHPEPSWPEPPRKDASWPEPPGASRPGDPRPDSAGGPTPWPDVPSPPPSWPEPPRQDSERPRQDSERSRQDSGRSHHDHDRSGRPRQEGAGWPEPQRNDARRPEGQDVPMSWPDTTPHDVPTSWPNTSREASWPDTQPSQTAPGGWAGTAPGTSQETSPGDPSGQPVVPAPVPAWAQPPTPSPGAWSNLSSPAPWPGAEPAPTGPGGGPAGHPGSGSAGSPGGNPAAFLDDPEAERTMAHGPLDVQNPPPPTHPADERTVAYGQHAESLRNDRGPAEPAHAPPPSTDQLVHPGPPPGRPGGPQGPDHPGHLGGPPPGADHPGHPGGPQGDHPGNPGGPQGPDHPGRPGSNLSRDPSDPENRFVTAGQISGSRTPPPERQQELWNTVFGDNYQAMNDEDGLDDERGKPIWAFALGGSVAVALVIALVWAFLWGPLAGADEPSTSAAAQAAETSASPSQKPTKTSTSIGPLPKYPGKASPVIGRVPDAAARISMPRLGGSWQLDQRTTVKGTYGFDTRQYVQVAPEKYAQVMSAPLSARLAKYYDQDDLEPCIRQVVLSARKSFFPEDNKVRKIAQQAIKVGDQTGRLIAYSLTSSTEKATLVTMAINTGANVPAIVYISIPSESKKLLPDIRTVMNQVRLGTQS